MQGNNYLVEPPPPVQVASADLMDFSNDAAQIMGGVPMIQSDPLDFSMEASQIMGQQAPQVATAMPSQAMPSQIPQPAQVPQQPVTQPPVQQAPVQQQPVAQQAPTGTTLQQVPNEVSIPPSQGPSMADLGDAIAGAGQAWGQFATGIPTGILKTGQDITNFGLGLGYAAGDALGVGTPDDQRYVADFVHGDKRLSGNVMGVEIGDPRNALDTAREAYGEGPAKGVGEFVGGALAPAGNVVLKGLKEGVKRAALEGALTGGAYGAVTEGGMQHERGEKPSLENAGKMAGAGAVGATVGAALGGGTAKVLKHLRRESGEAPNAHEDTVAPRETPVGEKKVHAEVVADDELDADLDDVAALAAEHGVTIDAKPKKPTKAEVKAAEQKAKGQALMEEYGLGNGELQAGVAPKPAPAEPAGPPNMAGPPTPSYPTPPKGMVQPPLQQPGMGPMETPGFPSYLEFGPASEPVRSITPVAGRATFQPPKQPYLDLGPQAQPPINPQDFQPPQIPYLDLSSPEPTAPLIHQEPAIASVEPPKAPEAPVAPEPKVGDQNTVSEAPTAPPIPGDAAHVGANKKFYAKKMTGGYEVVRVSDGQKSQRKVSLAEATRLVDAFDAGERTFGQGRRAPAEPAPKPQPSSPSAPLAHAPGSREWVQERINSGVAHDTIPNLSPENKSLLEQAAQAKREVDQFSQDLSAAQRSFVERSGQVPASKKLTARQEQQLDAQFPRKAKGPGKPVLQGLQAKKPEASMLEFGAAKTRREQGAIALNDSKVKAAKAKYDALLDQIDSKMESGELPSSITIGKGDTAVNFNRSIKRDLEELPQAIKDQRALEAEKLTAQNKARADVNKTIVSKMLKEIDRRSPGELDKNLADYDNASTEQEVLAALMKTDKNRSLMDVFTENLGREISGKTLASDPFTATTVATINAAGKTAKSAEGMAAAADLKKFAGDHKNLNPLRLLRRSVDVLQEQSPAVHGAFWQNVSKEAQLARGLKFTPEEYNLVNNAIQKELSDAAILRGEEGLKPLGKEKLKFLVLAKHLRKDSAKRVEKLVEQLQGMKDAPQYVKDDIRVLEHLAKSLRASGEDIGDTTGGAAWAGASQMFNDYVFRWNPAFHALNRTDPLISGSARVGLQRVTAAMKLQQMNRDVAKFADSFNLKGVLEETRYDVRRLQRGPLAKLSDKLKDLPSERWNNNDMLVAGLIHYGDKGKMFGGGGKRFVEDLVAGRVSPEETTKAIAHALQITNDVNGVGSFGIDRDLIGRVPAMRVAAQFLSQPVRVARLMAKAGDQMKTDPKSGIKQICTYAAMATAFGGSAALPKEVQSIWQNIDPDSLNAFEKVMEIANLPSYAGRNLSDKLRYSLMPLGGVHMNAVIDTVSKIASEAEAGKFDKAALSTLFLAIPGGATIRRGISNFSKVGKTKETQVFGTSWQDVHQKKVGTVKQPNYTLGEAFADTFLPGDSAEVGAGKMRLRHLKR